MKTMCVAAPGKIIEINGTNAVVEYASNKTTVSLGITDAKIGDTVLVHAGIAIQVISGDEAEKMTQLFEELEELSR